MRSKLIAIILLITTLAAMLSACRAKPSPAIETDDPNNTSSPAVTQGAEGTEVPQWMVTPDPAAYQLGEDGFFDDEYLTAYWPAFLAYRGHLFSNNAQYDGYLSDGKKLLFSYVTDDGANYEDEVAGFDKDSYQRYMQENMNSYFFIKEFGYLEVDGHPAMRVLFDYDPPEDPEHLTHVLEYCINVNGWVLGLTFTTQSDSFPPVCDECIKTIKFKDGYR